MLKYIPMLISLVYVLNTALSYFYFDNYVREGKLPRGKHEIGFKELS